MRPTYLLLLLLLPAFSCVTSGDFQRIADSLADLEAVVDDETKTTAEVQAKIQETRAELEAVAETVDERTDNILAGASTADVLGAGGLLSVLTGIGVNLLRDSRRRQRGERVGADSPTTTNAG